MSREIKFRAWDKKARRWKSDILLDVETGWIGRYSMFETLDEEEDVELVQYTGLKDKNGVEIYEGDLFDFGSGRIGTVVWDERCWCGKIGDLEPNGWINPSHYKVIGNIYETPELLDGDADE